ncbi:MAG: Rid family hydrolase [Alphaproteobacteria bacterium]|nr:Rid family hydrolase [Alphaproteobacteria bacterium]
MSLHVITPVDAAVPASKYAAGIVHALPSRRLVISGQIGVRADGTVEAGMEAQMRRSFENLFAVLKAAEMRKTDLVKITVFLTDPSAVGLYREVRDEVMEGHLCASTLLIVSGLASPDFVVEIEAEAVA